MDLYGVSEEKAKVMVFKNNKTERVIITITARKNGAIQGIMN